MMAAHYRGLWSRRNGIYSDKINTVIIKRGSSQSFGTIDKPLFS